MNHPSYHWNAAQTPVELSAALEVLSAAYPLNANGEGMPIRFISQEERGVQVERRAEGLLIRHGSLPDALRGVGMVLSGLEGEGGSPFTRLGVMLDCSRNAVMKVSYVKRWLRQLSLLGYNLVMLYTEDTYQLPDEPFFGYKRGGYTYEEVREIDAFAASLGIEVVACIQTLGHLHQILKWDRFKVVRDTPGVLLVDEEETYRLIEKMILFWSGALGSRRVHIGMDEAHDMGRGRFLDIHGFESQFEVFSRHLSRVKGICTAHGLEPMIWSDMFFRMGNPKHAYYDRETVIPDSVREKIPAGTKLVYWDYESKDEAFYREWISRHRELAGEPIMASGIWTWRRFWYDHATTEAAVRPCVAACREEKLSELIFTMWGDGGSYCEFDSAWAGLAWAADLAFGGKGEEASVAPIVQAVCNADYRVCLLGERLHVDLGDGAQPVAVPTLLWDDPLLGIGWEGYKDNGGSAKVLAALDALAREIPSPQSGECLPDTRYLSALIRTAQAKLRLRESLVAAWESGDRTALCHLAEVEIPGVDACIGELETAFRTQWMRRNKPFGMEATQIRFGAMRSRCRETATRLKEYLAGEIETIDELNDHQKVGRHWVAYFYWLATGSVNF